MPLSAHPDLAARFTTLREFTGGEGRSLVVRKTDAPKGAPLLLKFTDGESPLAEASVLASLDHPGVPRVHEIGLTSSGTAFVLRDFVPGLALSEVGKLDRDRALAVAIGLGEILAFVHLRGILHLDVKPANVILDEDADGDLKVHLVDFGFAQRGSARARRGTPFFAAPEVTLGAEPDARADLFSLGATLVALLLEDVSARARDFFRRFPREDFLTALGVTPADFPAPFDRVLPRLLGARPELRFADAQEVLEALRGRGGRPSPAALTLDPVAAHGATVDAGLCDLAEGVDLELHGLTDPDRRALALYAACVLGDARHIDHDRQRAHLSRGARGVRRVELAELGSIELTPFLTRALGLDEASALHAAESLLASGARSAATCSERLRDLAEQGRIRPDGAGWCWPDAAAGRIALDHVDAPDDRPVTERIIALASRGRLDAAQALARDAIRAEPTADAPLRAALARGFLLAGEPIRALPLTPDLPLLRARATLESGDLRRAERAVMELPETVEHDAEDERRILRAGLRYQQARFGEGLAELEGCADDDAQVLVLRGALLAAQGRHGEAHAALDRAIAKSPAEDRPFVRAAALVARGDLARRIGELRAAAADQTEALDLFRRVGNAHATASAALNLGVIAKDLGERGTAREHLRRARALFHHVGDRARELTAEANLGIVLLGDDDAASAIARFDVAIEGLTGLGAVAVVELCRAFRAQAHARLGNRDAALTDLSALAASSDPRVRQEAEVARGALADTRTRTPDRTEMETPTERAEDGIQRAVFRTFLAVNRRLASERDLERAMNSLLEAAETVTGARASYLLVERSGGGLKLEFASHIGSPQDRAFSRSLANKSLSAGRTMTAEDALGDRDLMNMPSVRDLRIRSAMCVPFRSASGTAGALYVEHSGRAGAFGPREAEMLEALADQASIAVERMLREEALSEELAHSKRDLQVAQRRLGRTRQSQIVGRSPAVVEMRRHIDRFARSDLSVLVQGETGTGKELVARALHDASPRAAGPFVSENCSAIPPELMESELFGHQKGAFTGADQERIGLVELANGGTLFLDEVGDMPPSMQVKLLRALQERTIRRVGGRESIPIDVRLVSATHRDLPQLIKAGEFREDLYFRIAAGTIRVPPLRERPGDVELLARHFVDALNREQGRSLSLTESGLARLRAGNWPGNVRELEHVIARAVLLTEGDALDLEDLPTAAARNDDEAGGQAAARWPAIPLNEAIYRTLHAALRATEGDKSKAAKLLQISRTALYEKLRREQTDRPVPGSFHEL